MLNRVYNRTYEEKALFVERRNRPCPVRCDSTFHDFLRGQVHTGLITLDNRSRIYKILAQNGWGIVNSLAGESPVEVMVHPTGLDQTTRERILQGPIHVSIVDN